MKRLVYITILLMSAIWFSSCGSHRSNMKQEAAIESGSNHQRKDTVSASEQNKKTEAEDVTEETEEMTTNYDTSKPIDPATGKPPILSEIKKNTKKESNNKKTEDSDKTLNKSSAELIRDTVSIKDQKAEEKQKVETTVPKQIGGMLWALAALIGLAFAGWLVFRKRNK